MVKKAQSIKAHSQDNLLHILAKKSRTQKNVTHKNVLGCVYYNVHNLRN